MDREVEFSLRLVGEFLRFSLPDEALAVLAELPEDLSPEDKAVVISMRVHAQHQRQDLPKMLYLGETLTDGEALLPHAAGILASAYWTVGLKDKARRLLQVACNHVPTLKEMRELYDGKSEIPLAYEPQCSLEEILELAASVRLGYHFALENIIPLIWQCRTVTCCFSDQVQAFVEADNFTQRKDLKKFYLAVAQLLNQDFGIYSAFFVHYLPMRHEVLENPRIKLYLGTDPGLLNQVQELEELYWQSATPWQDDPSWVEIMLREATLLGYPKCCGHAAAALRAQGESLERTALSQYIREKVESEHWPEMPAPIQAYYTFEFYPCNPRCPEAESRERTLEKCYGDRDPLMLKLYQELLVKFNHYTILLPRLPYRQRIEGFDDQVESLLGDLGKRLAGMRQEQEKELQEEMRH